MKKSIFILSLGALLVGCAASPPRTMNAYSNYDAVPEKERGLWLAHQILVLGNEKLLNQSLSPNVSVQKQIIPLLNQVHQKRLNYAYEEDKLNQQWDNCSGWQIQANELKRSVEKERKVIDQYRAEGAIFMGMGALFCLASADCQELMADNLADASNGGHSFKKLTTGLGGAVDGLALDMARKAGVDINEVNRKMRQAKVAESKLAACSAKVKTAGKNLERMEDQFKRYQSQAKKQCQAWFAKLPKAESNVLCDMMLASVKTFNRLYK